MLGNEWHTGSGSYEIIAAKRERDQGKKKEKKGGKHCNRLSLPRILFEKEYHLRRCSDKKKLKKTPSRHACIRRANVLIVETGFLPTNSENKGMQMIA